jgi:carboxyl-terminal processing protease
MNMSSRKFIIPLFPIALFSFLVFCSSRPQSSEPELMERVLEQLRVHHYQPVKLNDELSVRIYNNFLDKLDNDKRFFTQQDLKKLESFKHDIDDQLQKGSYRFMDSAWNAFGRRLVQLEAHALKVLEKPFDFTGNESWIYDSENPKNLKDDRELLEFWRKSLMFNTLERYYRKQEAQQEAANKPDSSFKAMPSDSLELKARMEVRKTTTEMFKRLRRMNRKDQVSFYINSITEIYDPHTNFMPPAEKQNFDIGMSGRLEGIGATLVERDGYIRVERIVPGSASHKQGDLKAGDQILKVAQGTGDPVDIVGMQIDEAIQLIRGKKRNRSSSHG